MPDVVGLTQADATALITQASLVVAVTTGTSPTAPVGTVISQNPAAGTNRNFGTTVNIVVSIGTVAPNVVTPTRTLAAATTIITNAGMVVGTVTSANSATVPSGNIISQSPAAGTIVDPGSAMALVKSLGPPTVLVPNVTTTPATTRQRSRRSQTWAWCWAR